MRSRATSLSLVLALVLLAPASPAVAAAPMANPKELPPVTQTARVDALTRALASGRISEARYALERARSLFDLGAVEARFGDVESPDPRDATVLLRDLVLRLDRLAPADRAAARRILARPTDGNADPDGNGYSVPEATPLCDPEVCVHYVETSGDRPDLTDVDPANGVPDYVERVLGVLGHVWGVEVDQMGYRAPRSDASSPNDGGDNRLDVYLSNIGGLGLYGYCSTDDPAISSRFDVSAYCVLDDDYTPGEFGYPDPMDPLAVTAAHEFFHAVQFAYDIGEDGWLLESTATWIEDELYDGVNDNRLYLPFGPLGKPLLPLDRTAGLQVYGSWIFWRFLAEFLGPGSASDPTIVRAVWRKADASPGAPDQYSTQALSSAISARTVAGAKWRLRRAFRTFSSWNARPRAYYQEGNAYPAATVSKTATLSGANATNVTTATLDHLTSRFVVIKRGSGLKPGANLRVRVDGPPRATGSEASVSILRTSGKIGSRTVRLNASGNGAITVDFDGSVTRVIVIMTNGSSRYTNCFSGQTAFACFGGRPVDENRSYSFRVTVV